MIGPGRSHIHGNRPGRRAFLRLADGRVPVLGLGLSLSLSLSLLAALLVPALAQTRQGPPSVAPVAEKLIDAVVNISTKQTLKGTEGAAPSQGSQGRPVRGVLRRLLRPQGRQVSRPQGHRAGVRLRHRRQGRADRHQQPRDRRCRRDHHQLQRRHQAHGREDPGQGLQDRSGAAEGDAEAASGSGAIRLVEPA